MTQVSVIIPFRAGSKTVPGKNLRRVAGRILWEWSLSAAWNSMQTKRIVVTTDCDPVMATPAMYFAEQKVEYVRRPPELATDDASLDDAIIHAIDEVGLDDEDIVVLLQPTVPVRRPGLVDDCVRCFQSFPAAKSLVTANKLHYVWAGDAGMLVNPPRVNRQAMESGQLLFEEDGSVFVVRAGDLRRTRNRIIDPVILIETERTIDIDTERDMEFAEFLLQRQMDERDTREASDSNTRVASP